VRPYCLIPSLASSDDFIHGLTIRDPLRSRTSLRVELSELGQSKSVISLVFNVLNLLCDEYIRTFNKLMEARGLMDNHSHKGVFDVEQATDTKIL